MTKVHSADRWQKNQYYNPDAYGIQVNFFPLHHDTLHHETRVWPYENLHPTVINMIIVIFKTILYLKQIMNILFSPAYNRVITNHVTLKTVSLFNVGHFYPCRNCTHNMCQTVQWTRFPKCLSQWFAPFLMFNLKIKWKIKLKIEEVTIWEGWFFPLSNSHFCY